MNIEFLADRPSAIPIIAQWIVDEWGTFDQSITLDSTIAHYQKRLNKEQLPMMLVAFDEDRPIGCVSLKLTDMTDKPQYSPWLGSMYVIPERRHLGIGTSLLTRALYEANRLNVDELFLWTATAQGFYARHGFRKIEDLVFKNQNATIMKLDLRIGG